MHIHEMGGGGDARSRYMLDTQCRYATTHTAGTAAAAAAAAAGAAAAAAAPAAAAAAAAAEPILAPPTPLTACLAGRACCPEAEKGGGLATATEQGRGPWRTQEGLGSTQNSLIWVRFGLASYFSPGRELLQAKKCRILAQ